MCKRTLATSAVLAISVAALAPGAAHADASSPTTIYVEHDSASCTDSGTGTHAAPFCTLQAGIDAANVPGDTVSVLDGYLYAPVTISNAGTASAPITIEAGGKGAELGTGPTTTAPGFTFVGASYVTVKDFLVGESIPRLAYISASNHITMDSDSGGIESATGGTVTVPGIEIAGSSSYVTLSRNQIDDVGRDAPSIQVDPGSTGDVITTNGIRAGVPAILVNGAPGTAVTSNTVVLAGGYLCNTALSLTGASTGSYIENNVLEAGTSCDGSSTPSGLLSVASAATPGTTVDYNDLDPNPNLVPQPGDDEGPDEYTYDWAGKYYETVAQFTAASGQGQHDVIGDPDVTGPWGFEVESDFSPVVNSANSDAPGELATDVNGKSRVNDPLKPDTGAGTYSYYDRGAAQIQPPANPGTTLTTTANGALGVTAQSVAWLSDGWSFDFGDGSAPVSGSYGAASHTYAKPGTYTITVTGTSMVNGQPFTATGTVTTTGSDYTPLDPTRILDTRKGIGAPKAKITPDNLASLNIAGNGSIPADATAVVLNVTVTDTTGNGYVSVIPSGGYLSVSNLNYLKGQTVTNAVIVPVGADGTVQLYDMGPAGGSVDLIADVSGYFTRSAGSGYTAVTPARMLDTRHGTGAPAKQVAGNSGLSVGIAGADSIPSGVTAVALHVTATDTTGNGWIAAEPDGAGTPTTSNLNYLKGQTVSNTVIVPVAQDGRIELYNGGGTGSVDLIADVAGYFSTDSADAYSSVTPYRAWDSRKSGTPLKADGTTTYALNASEYNTTVPPVMPAGATLITNLTVTDLTANGFVTAFPAGTTRPGVSNLNYLTGQTVAGLSLLASTGSNQQVSLYNESTGHGDAILDVFGYFSG
ncbi:PKD domain-containing protein [Actinospica durhamensis]|uniref:PKD domain-containing protein n=1 Tax=Actinospica durhamensis TaxID=1508375 RepID=A0A941EJ53_9ACTN|nr:PKD domain-containing protein [Actinospica durhamensis]MBR7831715.1 PKD domain-containing protein [Actinospica durhamensis]